MIALAGRLGFCVILVSAWAAAPAGEASLPQGAGFSAKPAVTKQGDQVKIAFAVSAPTDVEVAVVDKDGKASFRTLQAENGAGKPFAEKDKWGLDR